jgi:hypothetical protein
MKTREFFQSIASGPSDHRPRAEQRARPIALGPQRRQSRRPPHRPKTLLVFDRHLPHHLVAHHNSRYARFTARLLSSSLDRRLGAGSPPESGLLLAARAQLLVSPVLRLRLAHCWADLLTNAHTPPGMRDPRASMNRGSIVANEPEIRELIDTLGAQTPVHVRGIAVLSLLLADGSGPLYNSRRASELKGKLEDVSAFLAPTAICLDVL